MQSDVRVCPFCGEPPGVGVFCEACGRNLAAVERLPTRAEWESSRSTNTTDARPLAERCAEATAAFLAAMHAAGDPGAVKVPITGVTGFRARQLRGWIVRAVHREDEEDYDNLANYDPGLVLTTDGDYHRLDSEVRGWGQRDFPRFHDTAAPEPVEAPAEERLMDELAAVLEASGVTAT